MVSAEEMARYRQNTQKSSKKEASTESGNAFPTFASLSTSLNSSAIQIEYDEKEEKRKADEEKRRVEEAKREQKAQRAAERENKRKRDQRSLEPITAPASAKKRTSSHPILQKFDDISDQMPSPTARTLRNKLARLTKAKTVNSTEKDGILATLNTQLEAIKDREATIGALIMKCDPLSQGQKTLSNDLEPLRSEIVAMRNELAELIVDVGRM